MSCEQQTAGEKEKFGSNKKTRTRMGSSKNSKGNWLV